jgi:hypothetical protein
LTKSAATTPSGGTGAKSSDNSPSVGAAGVITAALACLATFLAGRFFAAFGRADFFTVFFLAMVWCAASFTPGG